jgi:hypothetical protein
MKAAVRAAVCLIAKFNGNGAQNLRILAKKNARDIVKNKFTTHGAWKKKLCKT